MHHNYIKIMLLWLLLSETCFAQNHFDRDSIQLAQENKLLGIYWQNIQPSRALYYFNKSLEAYREAGNREEMVHLNMTIASMYHSMGDMDKKLIYMKKSLQDILELDKPKLEIAILIDLAKTYLSLHHYEIAEEYASIALKDSYKQDRWMLDEIMFVQAGIELRKGNEKKVRTILEKSQINHSDDLQKLQLLIELDSATGNFANAFKKQRQLEQVKAKKYSLEQLSENLNKALQAEMQHLNAKQSYLQPIYDGQKNQLAKMNGILIVLMFFLCGEGFLLFWFTRSFKRLKVNKIQVTDIHAIVSEKRNRLSDKYQALKQKTDLLQEKYDNLNTSSQSKTVLFKEMSNDLHVPLIQLKQNLSSLMADISEDQFKQAVAGLTNMVGDLSLLLENLLQWSKYQAQGIYTKPKQSDATALINDAIGQQKFTAAEKKITMSNALKDQLLMYLDEDTIKILFKTILQNIIKLSDPDATIILSGDTETARWLLINYSGEMPLKHSFLQQSHIDNYSTETTELGKAISIGWMLCRALMKASNGNIRIEDVSGRSFNIFLCFPSEKTVN